MVSSSMRTKASLIYPQHPVNQKCTETKASRVHSSYKRTAGRRELSGVGMPLVNNF
uniref:Uncharacterized protein n=1 Tax=Aegilops tauschii subsp. strangulata TaxID=200361 RepID=A0A452ZCI9_AEGTS